MGAETDIFPEVFERKPSGQFREVCTGSDADTILSSLSRYGELMRFRLTYDGELKAEGKSTRGPEKWAIRNHLHPQLAELWELHPALLGKTFAYANPPPTTVKAANPPTPIVMPSASERLRAQLRIPVNVGGAPFLPLVRHAQFLTCSLDILFLRKQARGSLISEGGDLDNRIKTFLDGLTVPTQGQLACGSPCETPLYCLLEDDQLISDFSVRTDRLLTRPGSSASEVRLIVDVVVKVSQMQITNTGFLGD